MLALSQPVSLMAVLPELFLVIGGCAAMIVGLSDRAAIRERTPWIGLAALVAGLIVARLATGANDDGNVMIQSGLLFDDLADYVRLSTLVLGIVILLVAWLDPADEERGEFFAMMLFSLAGLMLVGPSANLLILFLAIEVVSIPNYVMVIISQRNQRSIESGTKYFYLGALSAAMTAYGFSFLYGVAGSATLDAAAMERISDALQSPGTLAHALATIGILVSITGLLFKIAAFPLHWYVADVYQGASSPVAGMLGFVPKFAGVVAIMKIVALTGWATVSGGLFWMLWVVAALSMTIGNVLALRQNSIKRMLAFSGVAHAGYMLLGIMAGPGHDSLIGDGTAGVLYYAVVYGIANLGAFALLALLQVRGESAETVDDVTGLLRRYPGLALLMALSMLALMGLPPTTGFWGKMTLFGSGLARASEAGDNASWMIALVVIAAINSAIGAAYYLRVIAAVLLVEKEETAEPAPREAQYMGAMMCGFLTLVFTFYPTILLKAGFKASAHMRDQAYGYISKQETKSPQLAQTETIVEQANE